MGNIFDDLSNGIFSISQDESIFQEAVFPSSLPYTKVLRKEINLPFGEPMGKGNLCMLYSHNIKESIELMTSKENFLSKNKYRYYYYNSYYQGKIYNKRYRFNDFEKRKEYYLDVENLTDLKCKKKLVNTQNDNRNMFYDLFRYIEIFESICKKIPVTQYITLYWYFMSKIFMIDIPGYNNRFILVNLNNFRLSKKLKENLKNPLYIIYYTLLRKPELLKDINIDFFFYLDKRVLKINPSILEPKNTGNVKLCINQMMSVMVTIDTIQKATEEKEIQKEEITDETVVKITSITNNNEENIITSDEELVKLNKVSAVERELTDKVEKRSKEIADKVVDSNVPIDTKAASDTITKNVKDEINSEREIIEKLYYQNKRNVPKKSEASSARDELLRKEQMKIKIGNMTVEDIEKIKAKDVKVPEKDVSKVTRTTNENIKNMKFVNQSKIYNEKVMKKDIMDSILSLNDKSIPMFVRNIQIEDTSDELNYKETYTILLEDSNRKRHTINVDIPKFIDDRFLYIGGNKKLIKWQNYFKPIVKISSDMVQVVTNYNKMTIQRIENKSTSSIERLKKLISSSEEIREYFTMGNVYANNSDFITTVEYDDLSKVVSSFNIKKTHIFFDQIEAQDYAKKHNITFDNSKFIFIGMKDGFPCFIDINTQKNEKGESISNIIVNALPDTLASNYKRVKSPKRLMFAKVRVMKQFVTVGMLLCFWEGITTVLKKLKVDYRLENSVPSELSPEEDFLKFNDCVLVYKENVPISLVMNGIKQFDTSKYSFVSFDSKEPYIDYIKKVYGRSIIENALMNTYEFGIDPITLEILERMNLPTDLVSLIIYAVNLLSDSQFVPEINQNFSRVRCNEIIPAILYERLAKNYVQYRNYNGRKKFSIPRDCVIKELLALKTVEDYSTINPILEMDMTHAISSKGFRGVNLDDAYTVPKRSYDPSMTGVIAPGTSPDGSVGISKTLSLEPKLTDIRGFTEDNHNSLDNLKDVNLFSPAELSIPLSATIDDPNRLGHAIKQSKHMVPVVNSSPVLISNGMEEVARFHLSSDFVINADEDGEIVDYDETLNILIAKYKSGKCRAIDLNPNIVKNGGGGFFLSNKLITELKIGDKFKKDEVLAYHKDFFKNDKFNNCRMNVGTLTKVAIMSTYNTYEDATFITHKLSHKAATEMVFCKSAVIGKNSNVFNMVKKGDKITVGDPLISFDTSFEDDSINALLANLGESDKENILEGARNDIKSKYSGVIEDIKIYPTVDLDEMSPSLRKIVNNYYRQINKKKDLLDHYDPENKHSIVKCGILMNEVSHKITPNKFGVIKGEHVEDSVLIEFYIKHKEPLEVGSKIANFTRISVVK